jgi:hypothetical protein
MRKCSHIADLDHQVKWLSHCRLPRDYERKGVKDPSVQVTKKCDLHLIANALSAVICDFAVQPI